jgi:endonuclease YncB( thermonuclease family)
MRWLALLLLVAFGAPAAAQPADTRVVAAVDAVTFELADGNVFRLAGLIAPEPPLGYRGVWRTAERARDAAALLAEGVRLDLRAEARDRWGRWLGTAVLPDGRDLAEVLLGAGWAVVSGHPPAPEAARRLSLESGARARGDGLWSDPYYAVRAADTLPGEADDLAPARFLLVEGQVLEAAVVRGRAYLNFGPDWRTDFTATLSPDARRTFREAGLDPRDWQGRRIRVRGWLLSWNGPMIEVVSPAQVEVLSED